jgi:hypothetical protein
MSHRAFDVPRTPSGRRRARAAGLVLLLVTWLFATGCYSRSHNNVVSAPGQRFQLVVEAGRTDVQGTHFLLDAATGDLWRLDAERPGPERWVRVSDGPADAAEIAPPRFPFEDGEES